MRLKILFVFGLFHFFQDYNVQAADRFWIAGGAANWNSTANWSTTSGGLSGASIPGTSDIAIFDGNGTGDCNLNVNVDIDGLTITSGYTGTITHTTNTITVRNTASTLSGGTFSGGSANMEFRRLLTIDGCIFTSTSGTLELRRGFTLSSGSFAHNSGTVWYRLNENSPITGNHTLNNLELSSDGHRDLDIAAGTTVIVGGTFTTIGSNRVDIDDAGVLECQGNITLNNTNTTWSGNGTVTIGGNANQTITGTASGGRCELPNVIINKTGGTATFSNFISVYEDWTYTAGTVDFSTNSATVYFGNLNQDVNGIQTFENLTVTSQGTSNWTVNNDITVQGTFTLEGSNRVDIEGVGHVICEGDISITNSSTGCSGTGTLEISGTANQSIISTSTLGRAELPNVIINKTGGTATFTGIVSTNQDWTYTSGILDYTSNSATIGFTGQNQDVHGSQTFGGVSISVPGTSNWTVNNNISIVGTFSLLGTNRIDIEGAGIVNCEGDIDISCSSASNSGTGTVQLGNNANQTITVTSTLGRGELPNFIINKTGGTATFSGILSLIGDWTYTAGTVDFTSNNSTVAFTGLNQDVSGNQDFHNVTVSSPGTTNWSLLNNTTVAGLFTLGGNNRIDIEGPGTLNIEGDVAISCASASNSGTGTVNFTGNANQSIVVTSTLGRGELPNIIVNKSGGTATFTGTLSTTGDWTYTAGILDLTSNNSTIAFTGLNQDVSGNQDFNNVTVSSPGTTNWSLLNTATVTGLFTLGGNNRIDIEGPGTLNIEGDVAISCASASNNGTGTVNITGNANQSIVVTSTLGRGELPNVTINKTGGTATFTGILSTTQDWTYTAGTVDYVSNAATVAFTGANQDVNGTQTFENLTLNSSASSNWTLNSDITVEGTFTLQGGQRTDIEGGSVLNLHGDVNLVNTSSNNSGSGTIVIGSNANQAILTTATLGRSELPNVIINKSGGTATFTGIMSVFGNWTYTTGTTDFAANNATVAFTAADQSINGAQVFENLTFSSNASSNKIINSDITVAGTFTLRSGQRTDIEGTGDIVCTGDISVSNTATGNAGTGTVVISGGANQSIISTSTRGRGEFPNVIINKSGGTATFTGILSLVRDWTYTAGITDFSSNSATVAFTNVNQAINGNQVFENLMIGHSNSGDWDINGDVTVEGLWTYGGGNRVDIDGAGVLLCTGDISITSSSANGSGIGLVRITGTDNQTITSTVGTNRGVLPFFEINKTGGTAIFNGTFSYNRNFTYIQGNVDFTSNATTIWMGRADASLDGEGTSATMTFHNVTINEDIDLAGNAVIAGTLNLTNDELELRGNTCTITNSANTAITRSTTNAGIVSESVDNSGILAWNIGTSLASYDFPFENSSGSNLTMTIQQTAGDVGILSIATYPTAANNLPLPSTPEVVAHVGNISGADNSANVVDRFWQIDKDGPSGTVDVTFMYAQSERPSAGEFNLRAQRYEFGGAQWEDAILGQSSDASSNTVTVNGVTSFSPWALALDASPLPIELGSFNVELIEGKTLITWVTLAELNSDFFVVEKRLDDNSWKEILRQNAAYYSNEKIDYYDVDLQPMKGVNYYRLKSVDVDGSYEYSNVLSLRVTSEDERLDSALLAYPNPTAAGGLVYLGSIQDITIFDITGNKIKSYQSTSILDISELSRGVYLLLNNSGNSQELIIH